MATFTDKLDSLGDPKAPSPASLNFLSDLSAEERDLFRSGWPRLSVERRRDIVGLLANMAEDNIDLYFRPVFLILLEDKDSQVRLSAIEGLFEDNSKALLFRLMEMLRHDSEDEVREAASGALGRFTYLAQCGKLGPDAGKLRDALLHSARDGGEEANVRRRALEALGYLNGDSEVRALISDAYGRGGREAESALLAMGRSLEARWQQTILDELESDHQAMRYEAARAAGEMGLEDALPHLARLVDDGDLEVRLAVVWALGQIGGKPAAEALAHALKSKEPALREAAQEAIQELDLSANPMNII